MFDPTSCERMAITGSIASWEGMSANISSPFQVANCASVAFKPKMTASTSAHASREDGASLSVKIAYPKWAPGSEANVHYVQVKLPRGLVAREETLKKSCAEAEFAAGPANCPVASVVGHAVVRTPVLPVPLEGPAYFVRHGSEAFPSLVLLLKGYGVTIELMGTTRIYNGVTTSTFKSTPDVSFESFALSLPRGPHSALSSNGNLCRETLAMPTRIVGQNGATIDDSTKIAVNGCKPKVYVDGKHAHGGRATIVVQVPSAGRLIASGKGIVRKVKRVKGTGRRVSISVHLNRGLARKLRRGRRARRVLVHLALSRGTAGR